MAKCVLTNCDNKYAAKNDKYGDIDAPPLPEETRITLFKIFAAYDRDHSGTLDAHELSELLKKVCPYAKAAEINRIYSKIDADSNGRITYEEFCFGVAALQLDLSKVQRPIDSSPQGAYEWEIPYNELVIKRQLGEGSFGVVYQGSWRGTSVAIKKLKTQGINQSVLEDFKAEIGVLGKLRHPNVMLFMGACTQPPNLCIVTEFLAGGGLEDYAHGKKKYPTKWTTDEALRKGVQILKGLNYLHLGRPQIVHRDLKLQNILLDKDMNVKLADFGLSCVKPPLATVTDQVGTPMLMAPELLLGRPYNEKVDIYSFGILFWELLTGSQPFAEVRTLDQLKNAVVSGRRPPISNSIPSEIAQLIQACWHGDASKRPSAEVAMKAIAQYQGMKTPSGY